MHFPYGRGLVFVQGGLEVHVGHPVNSGVAWVPTRYSAERVWTAPTGVGEEGGYGHVPLYLGVHMAIWPPPLPPVGAWASSLPTSRSLGLLSPPGEVKPLLPPGEVKPLLPTG